MTSPKLPGWLLPLPEDDGLHVRHSKPWAKMKLDVVAAYLGPFVNACKGKAPRWFYIDGFAGPGVNLFDDGSRAWGSPLLALQARPVFHRCVLVEKMGLACGALVKRTESYGARAVVRQGDCNEILLDLVRVQVDRRAPALAVLDPEGPHLAWATVVGLARFKAGQANKVEQLILLPTDIGLTRELPLSGAVSAFGIRDLNRVFGSESWRAVYERRVRNEISPDEARSGYLQLYAQQLRDLGYKHVLDRQILVEGRRGRPLYFLVFATDNEAGRKIMDHNFDRVMPREEQGILAGMEPPAPRRLRS